MQSRYKPAPRQAEDKDAPQSPLEAYRRSATRDPAWENRAACFFADEDYLTCLDSLLEGATRYGCDIHAKIRI